MFNYLQLIQFQTSFKYINMDGFKLHRFQFVFHLNNYIIWNDTIIFTLKITLEITETVSSTFLC